MLLEDGIGAGIEGRAEEEDEEDWIGPEGDPSHRAQNWTLSLPSRAAAAAGSRMSGVVRQTSQCRSVRVQPFNMYSPSYRT